MSLHRLLSSSVAFALFAAAQAHAGEGALFHFVNQGSPDSFVLLGTLSVKPTGLSGSELGIALHFTAGRPYLELRLTGSKATLLTVQEGKSRALAETKLTKLPESTSYRLFRDRWRAVLFLNGQHILTVRENTLTGGKAGVRLSGQGIGVKSMSLQPLTPIYFTDDFTREAGGQGEWETRSGSFKLHQIKAHSKHGQAVYSSNAFRWESATDKQSLAAAGHWFWRNYQFAVSVRPKAPGRAGQYVLFRDDRNYVAFWADCGPAARGCRLVQVRDGKERTLARGERGVEVGQWHRLNVKVVGAHVQAGIDGRHACAAHLASASYGRVGIASEGSAQFDDVSVISTDGFHADESSYPAPVPSALPGLLGASQITFGDASWSGVRARLELSERLRSASSLLYGLSTMESFGRLHIHQAGSKRYIEAIRQSGQAKQVLGRAELPRKLGALETEFNGDTVCVLAEGKRLLSLRDPAGTDGPMGLAWDRGKVPPLKRIDVDLPSKVFPEPVVNEVFVRQATMRDWANPSSNWLPKGDGTYWHASRLFGDFVLALDESTLLLKAGTWGLLLAETPSSAAIAQITGTLEPGRQGIALALSIGGKQIAAKSLPRGKLGEGVGFALSREADLLSVLIGRDRVLSAKVPGVERWHSVGFRSPRAQALAPSLKVNSPQILNDVFSHAPVKWWADRGDWDVRPRWPCDDRWSFLGGVNSESPLLWSKYAFSGDMVVDAWLALYMDNVGEPHIGYKHISDLNVTICGDGRNLASGYSFQFAAKHNTVTQMRRLDKVVAETAQVIMVNPRRLNVPWQRHWYHLRIEKKAGHFKYSVDGTPALEFKDPDPLPGGHLGLWTWRGGLMVARVRVSAERSSFPDRMSLPPWAPAPTGGGWEIRPKPLSVFCSSDKGTGGWSAEHEEPGTRMALGTAGSRRYLKVRNEVSGGPLCVAAALKPFDAQKFPVLSFDFRADPDTKVNLYLKVSYSRVIIPLTGAELAEPGLVTLPPAQVKADGNWHHVKYDLLAALKTKFPSVAGFSVKRIEFAAPFAEYLRSGFGGNPYGCTYGLDNVALQASQGTTAEEARALLP